MYFIYILKCKDGSLYTGITTDVVRRFAEHQSGVGGHYTRAHGAVRIVYTEKYPNRSLASKREAEIKGMSRVQKLHLLML
ncbi:MAG: GIY-YIG nuclease family protein [bacterium]